MSTHTHKGHCQCCGRVQAVHNTYGTLAKHGYKVQWGFFQGTCPGSDHAPLEKDRTRSDAFAGACRARADSLSQKRLEDITHVTVELRLPRQPNSYRTRYKTTEVIREVFESEVKPAEPRYAHVTWEEMQQRALDAIQREIKSLREHADDMNALADKIHGKELEPNFDVNERIRQEFPKYREAYARAEELKQQGWKPRVTRNRYGGGCVLTATRPKVAA